MPWKGRGPVRYAVVGLGHIAQVAVLPAFAHARRNSRLAALVSDDRDEARELAGGTACERTYSYDEYDDVPRAGRRGLHRAAELDARRVHDPRRAGRRARALREADGGDGRRVPADDRRLPRAPREADDRVPPALRGDQPEGRRARAPRPDRRAEVLQLVVLDDGRAAATSGTKRDLGGGTLYDIGVYCINAARYLFRAEPKEVMAISVNSGAAKLAEIDESTGALLRFDGERVAAFVTSFNAADVASYRIVGTKGQLHVDPAYEYAEGLAYELTIDGKTTRKRDRQARSVRAGAAVLLRLHPEATASRSRRVKKGCRTCASSRRSTNRPRRARRSRFRRIGAAKRPTGRQRITRPGVKKPPAGQGAECECVRGGLRWHRA